ncbi:subclass B3 metallo-beta-lactamase [Erythrobacter sp. KY5]|uniref:subclass B3 metallo-beta-lactamase n=1 Tax=Erythrobacter sp. KY5 TaxID=2011159 RepID=UPI0013A69D63|nr:subclass B3 metallo-beta-lactamase [Erythrobacter sp. KY5]
MYVSLTTAFALLASSAVSQPDAEARSPSADIQRFADDCEPWDNWDKPAQPFRIHGTTYYVGTCGISAILITDPEGHILLDTGTETGAEVVAANIAALGFDIRDVTLIGFSHEHFDHIGGIEKLREMSGAMVVSSPAAAPVLQSGVVAETDPQAGMHEPFAPTTVDFIQQSGEGMGAGDNFLVSLATPGHSPGAMSWYWKSCDGEECLMIVYADSLSPVSADDYRFSDHPEYLRAYREGIARIAELDCDILLTPHPSHSKMIERAALGRFDNGISCEDFAAGKTRDLDARLESEAGPNQ